MDPTHPFLELFAKFFQARPSASLDELAKLRQSSRHGDRVSGKSARLIDGSVRREPVHDFGAPTEGADRKSSADDLAQSCEVRQHVVEFLRAAGRDPKSGHDFIEDEDRAFRVAEVTQPFEKAWFRQIQSRVSRNRLENDRRNFAPVERQGLPGRP